MKLYEGKRTEAGCVVAVDGRPLPLRHDIRNHSATGYAMFVVMPILPLISD